MDKEKYWANKKAGKRGQGEIVSTLKLIKEMPLSWRKSNRRKQPSDPKFTKKSNPKRSKYE